MRTKFKNANEAYEYFHNEIIINGHDFDNTKALFNVGFTLEDPVSFGDTITNLVMVGLNLEMDENIKTEEVSCNLDNSSCCENSCKDISNVQDDEMECID